MTSVSSRLGVAQQTVYAATKAGLESCCKVWATELGKEYSATVNCVAPGPISTDMWWDSDPKLLEDFQPIIDATPAAARVGDVGDVVPVVM
jgi:NAD(P)-dependent dehydrogenase (short-subunit alcohol dehydrogenase family)